MLRDILQRIDQRLEILGLSESGAARDAGLGEDAIRNVRRAVKKGDERRGVSTNTLLKLAPVLKTTAAWLIEGESGGLRRDLPIRGTAAGRHLRGGDFSLEKPIGHTWRPPALEGAEDAYAFIVTRSSMEPEFRDGALHIANPGRPAKQGDPVVVLTRFREDGPVEATLGHLVEDSRARVAVVKRQPPGSVTEFVPDTVIRVDRVLTTNEIFG